MNLPYKIKVVVVQGPRLTGAAIIGYADLWAELVTGNYRRGDQVVYIKGGRRLHPGVYGGRYGGPIVKMSDLPKRTIICRII